jgi:hypothetical protein
MAQSQSKRDESDLEPLSAPDFLYGCMSRRSPAGYASGGMIGLMEQKPGLEGPPRNKLKLSGIATGVAKHYRTRKRESCGIH